jgi:mannose-6-phosphate isomerase
VDRILETTPLELLSLPLTHRGELPRRTENPWGQEMLRAWGLYYAAKILHIEAGQRLSLQYHRVKEETLLLLTGRLLVELEGADGRMEMYEALSGQSVHIPSGCKHRLAAQETCEVLEVSTPELEDLVRLQDDFGRQ